MNLKFDLITLLWWPTLLVYQTITWLETGPWWSSGLERQSHGVLVMLKVGGSNPGHPKTFIYFFVSECRDKNKREVHATSIFGGAGGPQFESRQFFCPFLWTVKT